jgi:hypothetical protein
VPSAEAHGAVESGQHLLAVRALAVGMLADHLTKLGHHVPT